MSQPTAAQEALRVSVTQVDNSAYPTVTIYVRIEDEKGGIVSDLSQEQFTFTEDGQPVVITGFDAGTPSGVKTILTIDRSNSMNSAGKMRGAQSAAQAYIRQIRAQDQVALVAFDEKANTVQPFTADQRTLVDSVAGLRTGECTAIYDGLYQSSELVAAETGRRTVILITDGIDCREVPEFASRGSQHTLEESLEYARKTGVPVYVVGLGERNTGDLYTGIDEAVLKRIADVTGGHYYYAPTASELESLYKSLAVETQNEYVITYESPRPTYDGTRRDIRVEVGGSSDSQVYLEEHLLYVHSKPLVGAAMLVPLLLMLVAPMGAQGFARPKALPELPPDALSVCPHCGSQGRAGAKFCRHCGQVVAPVAPGAALVPECPRCYGAVRPEAKYCNHCGYRL